MRKYKKKELLNCIRTLKEVHEKINNVGISVRNEIFSQCQEMAIQIGTEIERVEGEETDTVPYLEKYCEELYKATKIRGKSDWKCQQKRMNRLLDEILYSIRKNIPDSPTEIVFLPYKASMWDAFDSIYRTALEEPNCNVTVMPIPYYNINPQGEVLAVEYEGSQFPDDISITDFAMVNLKDLHPDIIFIHNPYDEWNNVTQVPRDYFSSVLANQTEHLVYIPYFVTIGDKIKDDYCYLPAVRNAWRTFVQSDAVRDCYIKNGADSKKIVTMGSPKFDMVVQMEKEPPEMPEEWKEALLGKKVFLLNTHLNPIINDAKKTIDKLQQIFQLFKERDDVALLWRPHPLSIQTAKSMNPQILEQYIKLIEDFRMLKNGVYDDTPDVHRAIALSDAYIGHGSSLVAMYGITGKPMYMLSTGGDANVRMSEKDMSIKFSCGLVIGNELWVSAEDHNGVYRIDLETNKVQYVTNFAKEHLYGCGLYHNILQYENKLVFIPWKAQYIAIYDIKNGKMDYVLPTYEHGEVVDNLPKYSAAVKYEDCIYMFPSRVNAVKLSMRSYELEHLDAFTKDLEGYGTTYGTTGMGYQCGNKMWIPLINTNGIVEFDLQNGDYKKHFVKKSVEGFLDITGEGDWLYVLNRIGVVIKVNIHTFEEHIIWEYTGNIRGVPFRRIICIEGYLYLIPSVENEVIKICIQTDKKVSIKKYRLWEGRNDEAKSGEYIFTDNKLIICALNEPLNIYDIQNDFWYKKYFVRNDTEYVISKQRQRNFQLENEIKEYVYYNEYRESLESYLNLVLLNNEMNIKQTKEYFCKKQANINGQAGESIWKYIIKNS